MAPSDKVSSPSPSFSHSSFPSSTGKSDQDVPMGIEPTHQEHARPRAEPELPVPVVAEEEPDLFWPRFRARWLKEAASEFLGVMIMIIIGDGSVAQVTLSNDQKGNYQSISWGWGIGVMLGFYVAQPSGGHLNPAVTMANCMYRKFPWRKLPIYAVAQVLGAMTGAAIIYGNYRSAIDNLEGYNVRTVTGPTATAGIFCTYPAAFMTRTGMFFSEFVASSVLMFVIYALLDNGAGKLMPLGLFFLIFGIGATLGWETGYAINLARDFGPRLVTYMIGYGPQVWSAGGYYFWIPMVAPFFGCLNGGFLYDAFIYKGRESPINQPYMGFDRLFRWRRSVWSNTYSADAADKV